MSTQDVMIKDKTGKDLVEFAHETAKRLVRDNLTRAQIRNIFTEVRKIEALWSVDSEKALKRLNMLKPKMAYQKARQRQVEELEKVLSEAITQVDLAARRSEKEGKEMFKRFMDLFEAILAYHRAEGGRN